MNLIEALKLPSLQRATVAAGAGGLHRTIRWVPIVELPDPLPWVGPGDLLLTTGVNWPRDEDGIRALIAAFHERGLAGVALAVPRYFERMPEAARREADARGLPLLELPWEVQFQSVTKDIIGSILERQYRLQEQSEFIHHEIMRIALNAKDLREIVRGIAKLIGRKAAIQHPEGALLAGSVAPEWLRLPEEPARSASPGAASKPRRLPAEPGTGAPSRLVCPIRIKKELVGWLWVLEDGEPLSDLDLRAVQSASIVIALHIAQQRALTALESQLGNSFLDALIEDHFTPTPQLWRRAALHGFDPEGFHAVGVVALDIPVPLTREGIRKREKLAGKLKDAMEELGMPAVCSLLQNQIVFLIPGSARPEDVWSKIKAPELSMAVGIPRQGFEKVRQGYQEMMTIVPHMAYGQFRLYENFIVTRVLAGDREARRAFTDRLFAPLRRTKNGGVLVDTLLEFALTGFHLRKTADKLRIHPKTLRYRLDQAIALGGFDLHDPETQFNLQLAGRLMRMDL